MLKGIGLLACIGVLAACSPTTATDAPAAPAVSVENETAAIKALEAKQQAGFTAHSVDDATSNYADDSRLLGPGMTVSGKAAIREFFTAMVADPNGKPGTFTNERTTISKSGDLAVSSGPYDMMVPGPDGKLAQDKGTYLTVWKKGDDGVWKILDDVIIPSAAPGAAPAAPAPATPH